MPQAPDYLRAMFEDDGAAWKVLGDKFDEKAGVIFPKDPKHVVTEQEGHALDYLWLEWDYCYDPKGVA